MEKTKGAAQDYNLVSYFESGRTEKVSKAFAVEHEGTIYYLTSAGQMEKFKADPNEYLLAYGGWALPG